MLFRLEWSYTIETIVAADQAESFPLPTTVSHVAHFYAPLMICVNLEQSTFQHFHSPQHVFQQAQIISVIISDWTVEWWPEPTATSVCKCVCYAV